MAAVDSNPMADRRLFPSVPSFFFITSRLYSWTSLWLQSASMVSFLYLVNKQIGDPEAEEAVT
jgi:hypothetical protein